ncbi:SDR family NAD(P)-dependent oxidoreductase [Sporosarcina sp. PTS2304]|uniref:SDR family NAD(P)-dependent oxidoreductase n=1 Tax=Sporosarcina sp. PTS2304 TaxID=2283194 RepID=UPI000E0D0BC3|nr:SDR family NAD(P)-dependent oxidoreductase [Sporosarcina sp. PTS2304]AXI00223.1 SDR family NAD(P)-dependent oxidoreductase [Sporosarcina sp. PTS2304]
MIVQNKTAKQVAIVTGAGQGLGLAIAEKFLSEGKCVVFIDINEQLLQDVKTSSLVSPSNSSRTMFLPVDVSDVQAIKNSVKKVVEHWGRIDILVNNAGVRKETSVEDITEDEWNLILSVNLGGTFFFSQAVLDMMKQQQSGRIVNISSYGGQAGPLSSGAHYCASKAGQLVLTKSFARSLAGQGITVNSIAPAAINTPEMDTIDPEKLEKMKESIPVQRFGEADEVAQLVSYLSSEAASYITGATFDINGGLFMR